MADRPARDAAGGSLRSAVAELIPDFRARAAGWTVVIGNSTAFFAWLDPAVAKELIGDDLDFVSTSMWAPLGQAVPQRSGRFTVSGRWPFNSGCPHASWLQVGVIVTDGKIRGTAAVAIGQDADTQRSWRRLRGRWPRPGRSCLTPSPTCGAQPAGGTSRASRSGSASGWPRTRPSGPARRPSTGSSGWRIGRRLRASSAAALFRDIHTAGQHILFSASRDQAFC